MRKLTKKQKILIIDFINANSSAPVFAGYDLIDSNGAIASLNEYETVYSDIERFYTDTIVAWNRPNFGGEL